MKNWMKFLLWCFLFTGVIVILFFEHKKESLVTLNNPEIKRSNIEFGKVAIKKISNFSKKLSPSPLKKVLSSIIKKNS